MMNFNIEDARRYSEQSSEDCTRREEFDEEDELVGSRIDASSKAFPFPSSASSSSSPFSNKSFVYGEPALHPPTDLSLGSIRMLNGEVPSSNPVAVEKEHMFDKVVTPSDVGKLNRLVIPKQHAEKYFPLDSSSNEKGLLLNFEDRNGKPWRFRYSYWNSSQSYVMTKGWSRFVKEKKLDAGDIVSFQRGVGEEGRHRLFIDWRRRPSVSAHLEFQNQMNVRWGNRLLYSLPHLQHPPPPHFNYSHSLTGYNAQYQIFARPAPAPYYVNPTTPIANPIALDRSPMVIDSVPVVQGRTVGKRLRLFGVNMDCPIGPPSDLDDEVSSFHSLAKPPPGAAGSSLQLRLPSGSATVQSHDLSKKGKIPLSFDLDP